jgi:hypothetical protein
MYWSKKKMDAFTDMLEKLATECDQIKDPYVIIKDPVEIAPRRIALDYYPGEAIRMNMLHSRGCGTGKQKNTSTHAVCERTLKMGRAIRDKGEIVCGKTIKAFLQGDISSSPPGSVTCPECLDRIVKYGLNDSIRHGRFGAWEK